MSIEQEIDGRFRNEYHKGIINLTYTTNQLNRQFYKFVKSHGISVQQYNILKVLRGFGAEPKSINFIKERMLDKSSDVSRIVDRLVAKKFIIRTENQEDRRQKELSITSLGLSLLENMDSCENKIDKLLANLSISEVKELNKLLDKIRN